MTSPDVPLDGGNSASFVVRSGDTVRKPWTASSSSVHRLLAHLRDQVGDVVPRPLGRDDRGRQVLEFVPGSDGMAATPTAPDLERVGAIARSLHEATASFPRRDTDVWTTATRRAGDEIISHGDLAPWNLVRGRERWAFIDWDGAGPTTRIADLAYAARSFARADHLHPVEESVLLLRAVLDGYGASSQERVDLVPAMIERTEAMRDLLLGAVATGEQPWARMAVAGHGDYWTRAAAHLHRHGAVLGTAVR